MKKEDKDYQKEVRCTDAYRIAFPIGSGNDELLNLVCWKDDGTWGKHITIFKNEIPVGTFPIINNQGLLRLIIALTAMYRVYNGNIDDLKEYLNREAVCPEDNKPHAWVNIKMNPKHQRCTKCGREKQS